MITKWSIYGFIFFDDSELNAFRINASGIQINLKTFFFSNRYFVQVLHFYNYSKELI